MRFSFTTSVVTLSITLALLSTPLVSAKLTPAEIAEVHLKEGPDAKLCPPCLQKAMHNHFPHACARDLDPNEANYRPTGPTDVEERCVCLAFQDLFWMKADCSFECPHVFNEAGMKYFLPSSEIEGCDRWLDFETGAEKVVEGFPTKDKNHKPEVYEIAEAPPVEEGAEEDDGRVKVSVHMTHRELTEEEKKAKLEADAAAPEIDGNQEKESEATQEKKDAAAPEAESPKKDEL